MNKKILIIVVLLVVILGVVFLLTGNKGVSKKESLVPEVIYTQVSERINLPAFVEPSASDLELFYDIVLTEGDLYIYKVAEVSPSVDTIAIFKLADSSKAADLKTKLEAVKETQAKTMKDYNAEEYQIASSGIVAVNGSYVYLVMSKDATEIVKIINSNI